MLYLANPCGDDVLEAMRNGDLGMIDQPWQSKPGPVAIAHANETPWCADNGCFADTWEAGYWWEWLLRQERYAATCLFAVAPDVVGDAEATLERSRPWLPRIRGLGFPVAYVAQDGFDADLAPWSSFDVLFLGGTDVFKLGPAAVAAAAAARARGKRIHMGRVNSERRWRFAEALGCSTVDGTFLVFGPTKNLPRLMTWTRNNGQRALF